MLKCLPIILMSSRALKKGYQSTHTVVVKKKRKMLKYVRIDGSTPHHERQLNTQKFQKDPSCRVAIIGMLAGVGITLTEASHVFFAELHWTPGIILQAEDRAHRIGQKNNVIINYLVAKNSIDEPMWSIICNKVNVTSTALEGCRSSLKAKRINVQRRGQVMMMMQISLVYRKL